MKFLIDRCAGHRLAKWLLDRGHDVLESASLGEDPGDLALLNLAVHENRIVITIDTDFGKLVHMNENMHCGIVRLPDVPSFQRIELMDQLLSRHEKELSHGDMITIRGNKIRISSRRS
jgi:predicted nuclease of predicted toxin-antitoxin system